MSTQLQNHNTQLLFQFITFNISEFNNCQLKSVPKKCCGANCYTNLYLASCIIARVRKSLIVKEWKANGWVNELYTFLNLDVSVAVSVLYWFHLNLHYATYFKQVLLQPDTSAELQMTGSGGAGRTRSRGPSVQQQLCGARQGEVGVSCLTVPHWPQLQPPVQPPAAHAQKHFSHWEAGPGVRLNNIRGIRSWPQFLLC